MAWHQLSIIANKATAPEISDFFNALGAVSVTYMDAEDHPVYEPAPGETRIWDNTKIIALFETDAEPELVKKLLFSTFSKQPISNWQQEFLDDQVWERAWMEHFRPMKFADRLWVCPTGQEISEPDTACMTLDPGLAFGTGTHPTTELCLEWLAENDIKGKTFIDYGCGSGILAIAAALLGAEKVFAVDIDPQALTATYDNAVKNNVQSQIIISDADEFSPILADILIANILAQPLMELSEYLSKMVKTNGQLILSGILKEQTSPVIDCYRQNFYFNVPIYAEDWCRLDAVKKIKPSAENR